MESEFQDLEASLKSMRPAAPDAACMDRLLAAVEKRLPQQGDLALERQLAALRPARLPQATLDGFLDTVSRVPFPAGENVVLFPGKPKAAARPAARRPWLASAAAVAVLGGFTAFMIDRPAAPAAGGGMVKREETSIAPGFNPRNLSPAVDSHVTDTRDEGVQWTRDGSAMRRVRVVYMDRVRFQGPDGRIIEKETPRVETILVPEEID